MKNVWKSGRLGATVFAALLGIVALAPSLHAEEGSGTAAILPAVDVVAGSAGTWTIRYTAADTFIAGTIDIDVPDGWSMPQVSDSSAGGFVTVSTTGLLDSPAISISGRIITVHLAALDTSETVDVVYGDASLDPAGAAFAQTDAEPGVAFLVRSAPDGTGAQPIAASPQLDVVAGPATALVFLTPQRTFDAGGESAVMRVSARDEFGNPAPVPADQDIHLQSTGAAGRFSHLGGAGFAETDTVTIAAGTDTVSFYYRDTVAGTKTITASAVGETWTIAAQSATVDPAEPFRLVVSPDDTLATAGDFVRMTLRVEDSYGNASAPASDQTIDLFGQPGSFYATSNHSVAIAEIVIPNGQHTVYLDYRNTLKVLTSPYVLALLDQDGILPTLEAASALMYINHAAYDPTKSLVMFLDNKSTATADGVDAITVNAYIFDPYSNGIDGASVTIAATGSGNVITQPVGGTTSTGRASGTLRSTVAGSKTVSAFTGGITIVDTESATFIAGPFDPAVSDIQTNPASAVANGSDSIAVTVYVRDANGNPIAGKTVSIECDGSGNFIRQPAGVTGTNGIATGSVTSTVAEGKTIAARVDGVLLGEQVGVTFVTGPFDANVSDIQVDKTAIAANGVDSVLVTVTARDALGNPLPGRAVAIECTGSGNAIRQPVGLTGADGVATGSVTSTVAQAKTISARVDGLLVTELVPVTFTAGVFDPNVSSIQVDKTSIVADLVDSVRVTVTARDAFGNPLPGRAVVIECTGSGNAIRQPAGPTGADGMAVGSVTSTVAQAKTISARVDGVSIASIAPVTFVPGFFDPNSSDIGVDKTMIAANGVDSVVVTVSVRDAHGNPISGRSVIIECDGSGNAIRQPVGVTGSDGIARGSVTATVAQVKRIGARVDGASVTEHIDVTFFAGPFDPNVSDIQVDKTTIAANGVDSVRITVYARDAQGNGIAGKAVLIECTGSGNTIRQPLGATDSNGMAVGSARSTVAEGKIISARADGIPLTEQVAVTFTAGVFDPNVSTIQADKTSIIADLVDSVRVTVTARDALGNPLQGRAVVISCGGSFNTIRQPVGTTGTNGQAIGSVKSTFAEIKSIGARVDGVSIVPNVSVAFVPGSFNPNISDIAVDKTTITANLVDSVVVTVSVKDAYGNPISGRLVTLECTGSGNTIRQPAGLTSPLGAAAGSVKSTVAEQKTIRARVDGVLVTEQPPVTFVPGPFDPAVSSLAVSRSTIVANGVDSTLVTVTARDARGNPIQGRAVTIECVPVSGNTIRQPVGLTSALGVATGSVKSTVAQGKTISALVNGAPVSQTAAVSFVPGPFDPGVSDIVVDKTSIVANGADSVIVSVFARDAQGNPLAGKFVTIECTPATGNTIRQPSAVTGSDGRAVGSLKSTVAESKSIRARVDGVQLAEIVPVTFTAGALHHFVVTHGGSATAGQPAPVTIDARDAQNNRLVAFGGVVKIYTSTAIPLDHVDWGIGNAAGSILSEAIDTVTYQFVPADLGDAELLMTDRKAESVTLTARSGSVLSSSAAPIVVGHGAADSIFVLSGDYQTAIVGADVALPLVVGVSDEFGNPVDGVTVSFAIEGGGGSLDASRSLPGQQTSATTNGSGTAACEKWTLGTTSGVNSNALRASMPSGTTISALFTATAAPGPVASIVLAPASKPVTVSSSTTVTATLRDAFGNAVVNEYVTIYIKDAPDGHLSGAPGSPTDSLSAVMRRGQSNAAGTVSVTYHAPAGAGISDAIDAYSNTISSGNVVDAVYSAVASGATDLRATVIAGSTSQAGVTFQILVEAVDGNGNRDPANASHVILEPPAPGGFAFSLTDFGSPVTEATLAAGAATIHGRGSTAGFWQVTVRDAALSLGPAQFAVQITANDTVASYAVGAPAASTAGAAFTVTAEARDRFGNRATAASYAIAFRAVRAADSTLAASGALSVTAGTLTNGSFTGGAFAYAIAENIRIEVTSAANAIRGYSGVISVDNASAYRIAAVGSTDTSGVAVGDSLLLRSRVYDVHGNAVDGQSVFLTVQEGNGRLSNPVAVTDAGGSAAVWFRTDTLVGTNRVRAAILDASPEGLETQSYTVDTRPRTVIDHVALALPGSSFAAGETFGAGLAAYDEFGNLIDTDSSSQLRPIAERATIDFLPDIVTLSAGVGAFAAFDTVAGTNRVAVLSLAGDTLAPWSVPLAIRPAGAYRIVEVRGDTTGVVVGAAVELRARVRDRYGNAVPGEIVRFQITSSLGGSPALWDGTGAPNDGLVLTNAAGTAICVLSTDANAGINAVTASILDASPPAIEQVTFTVATVAGNIARFDVIPDGLSKTAGQSFSVNLTAYDLNGNVAVNDDTTRVRLGSSGSATFVPGTAILTDGRATVTARDTRAERVALRAETLAGGAVSWSDTVTVSPDLPSGAISFASIVPDTITANGASISAVTTQPVRDQFANVVSPGTLVTVTPSLGSVQSDDRDPVRPGVQRQTESNGAVSVFVRSAATPGTSTVAFQSVTGSASGSVPIVFAPAPACYYAGYLIPRHLVPTQVEQFRCSIVNGSPTGVSLSTQTRISFADSVGHVYEAHIPAPAFLRGSVTDTLDFTAVTVPVGMLGGTYTPRIALEGIDAYGSTFRSEFNAGSNSVSVSDVQALSVSSAKAIVSRGDTFAIDVRVRNGGGSTLAVIDIVPKAARGLYNPIGSWDPPLPNNLAPGAERLYRRNIHVYAACPLGPDTIDASVVAQANGSQVQDPSAYPNVAAVVVQSAASLSYVAGTLSPDTISRGQTHAISVAFSNAGQAAVILDAARTRLRFTDGLDTVAVSLGYEGALAGNRATTLLFPPVAVSPAVDPGAWPVSVRLRGTENGGHLDTTIVLSDPMRIVQPAALVYRAGTLTPDVVSKRSTVSFAVGVSNAGGAPVVCNPDSTRIVFTGGTATYVALLDGTRGRTLPPGNGTLYFTAVAIPADMAVGSFAPTVSVIGTENGLRFAAALAPSDRISVQEPSQLAITSTAVLPAPRVTADQAVPWFASIQIENNGGATVRLDSLAVRLFAGSTEVTGECVLTPLAFQPHVDTLVGGSGKAIVVRFDDAAGAMTNGTVVIESTVWGRDLNSGASLVATTEFGGKGSYLVQTPAGIVFTGVSASVDTVTALQTRDWTLDVVVRNSGESDIQLNLNPASTFVTFSTSADFLVTAPTALAGTGGTVLAGGAIDTLRYRIDRTGSAPGQCLIEATVRGAEMNSGRIVAAASGAQGVRGDVLVQTPAQLEIVRFTPLQDPVTISQGRDWQIDMDLRNTGGTNAILRLARLDSTRVLIPGGSGFVIENPLELSGDGIVLRGGAAGTLRFTVTTTGLISPERRVIAGSVLATEEHSGRQLYAARPAAASTDSVTFEQRPDPFYVTGSLAPTAASGGTNVSFELDIAADAGRHATLELDRALTALSFGDADGDTFRTHLSPVSETTIPRASQRTLLFEAGLVDTAIARGKHPVSLRLAGTENGNPFSAILPLAPDSVAVERAPQLSIRRIMAPSSVTSSMTAPWPVRMIVQNNGEASVEIDLENLATYLSFTIVGVGDRTYEYTVVHPAALAGSGDDTLAGGSLDSLVFTVSRTGSTSGIALVNGTVAGVDVNSGASLSDDTYSGGYAHCLVQLPGAPAVTGTVPSRATVTSAQTTSWQIACEVCNTGEAAIALVPDSARVFGGAAPLAHDRPAAFVEGGLDLPGDACKHLVFSVAPTPSMPAGADMALHARLRFVEGNSGAARVFDTRSAGTGSGAIRVQAPALLAVSLVENDAPRAPYVNAGQTFPVLFEIANAGEATADSIRVAIEASGSTTPVDSVLVIEALPGGGAARDTFVLSGGSAGVEVLRARLRSAIDANSLQRDLVEFAPALDDTALVSIQNPASLAVLSVAPSQTEVNAGQTVDWTVRVDLRNGGGGPLEVDAPRSSDIVFSRLGTPLADYLVIPPERFVSGAPSRVLAGGASDALVYLVSSTGRDTGSVTAEARIGWSDRNDPPRLVAAASGDTSVHVRPPSGLRIVSVTSGAPNNALYPNTSVVDTGQAFPMTVLVENTGGDDLDSVTVRLSASGGSAVAVVGDSMAVVPSKSEHAFSFAVTAAPSPGVELIAASIVRAVSINTGEPVTPAEAVESTENLRIELPALLACGAAITSPAGALDDTLSAGQSFVLTAVVTNGGEAAVDETGAVALALPAAMTLVTPGDPLVKPFLPGEAVTWTIRAPSAPSLDTVVVRISAVPKDVNRDAPASLAGVESRVVVRTEAAAGIAGCTLAVTVPAGAVDGSLSTEQEFVVRAAFTPSANADSVWIELTAPAGFFVVGDRYRFIGRGTGVPMSNDWLVRASAYAIATDTMAVRAGGKDENTGARLGACRATFPVQVVEKAVLSLGARISGPDEALDGIVSVSLPFTLEATVDATGTAGVDTAGARVELVLPPGQGYALDGALETFRKPFYPGTAVTWRVRAPGGPTSPANIQFKLVEPFARDVNTNLPCAIETGEAFVPIKTESGAVLMSNISALDTIPPFVVPQGAHDVPVLRVVFRNSSGYTVGLDTIFVSVEDGRGQALAHPSRLVSGVEVVSAAGSWTATADSENPVPVTVGHGLEVAPAASETLLVRVDVAPGAPPGELRIEIARSADVAFSVSLPEGGLGPVVGVVREIDGGDIAGSFRSGPLSIMSGSFEEYVHNYPNPFRAGSEQTKISYFLTRDSAVTVRIYDLAGSLVWTKEIDAGSPGSEGSAEGVWHELPWDGRNAGGELVRNGVYLCKVEAGGQSALFKIAVAK